MKLLHLIFVSAASALAQSHSHHDSHNSYDTQNDRCLWEVWRFERNESSCFLRESTYLQEQQQRICGQDDIAATETGECQNGTNCDPYVPRHKWTHTAPCLQSEHSPRKHCVFTDNTFAHGRGISIITTARRADYLATNPAFAEPNITQHINQDLVRTATTPPVYAMREFPGKGMGLVATTHIRRGDLIMANTASIIIDYRAFEDLPKDDYQRLQTHAVDFLPSPHRAALLNLSTHDDAADLSHTARVDKLLATNAFDIDPDADDAARDHGFYVVFPEIARMNHDCRANADYFFDHATLAQYIHATRDIAPGEELTLSYINPLMPREARMARLKELWGFECACRFCQRERARADASDARIGQIEEVMPQLLQSWGGDQKEQEGEEEGKNEDGGENGRGVKPKKGAGCPEMAELLISLYEQEELGGMMYEAYAAAAREYNGRGDVWTAVKYARLAIDWGIPSVGERDADVLDMQRLVANVWIHWSWMWRMETRGERVKWEDLGAYGDDEGEEEEQGGGDQN